MKPLFDSRSQAVSYLDQFQFHGFRLGLERIEAALKALGDPQNGYPCIHVAGTNGKGSVCAALSNILSASGLRVGLYTSPHLYRLNERFRVDMEPVSDAELRGLVSDIAALVESGMELSYFEFTTAMAFLWFDRKSVDIAIVETGLGGRLDATNVITPLVSVITNISLEHQSYLGTTIGEIAREKAGIVKTGVPAVTGVLHPEAESVILEVAASRHAACVRLGKDFSIQRKDADSFDYSGRVFQMDGLRFGLPGDHQVENAAVALAALETISGQDFEVNEQAVRSGLQNTSWPGRSEFLQQGDRLVLLDGAHNSAGIGVLEKLLVRMRDRRLLPRTMYLMWACSDEGGDKDVFEMAGQIAPLFKKMVITEPPGPRKPVTVEMWRSSSFGRPVSLERDWKVALDHMLREISGDSMLVVSGSLYLVGPARHELSCRGFRKARVY